MFIQTINASLNICFCTHIYIFLYLIPYIYILHNNFHNIVHYMCVYFSIRFFNNISNIFRRECRIATPQCRAQDDQIAKNLWDQTCRLLRLECDEDFGKFLKIVSRQIVE